MYGTIGTKAPDLKFAEWLEADGSKADRELTLTNLGLGQKPLLLYCFQSWCPGCHSHGFPTLQRILANKPKDLGVAVIQTVFEGHDVNTFDKLVETRQQYDLPVPFIQDNGKDASDGRPQTMIAYQTGGTPWFISIDESGIVTYNDFRLQ